MNEIKALIRAALDHQQHLEDQAQIDQALQDAHRHPLNPEERERLLRAVTAALKAQALTRGDLDAAASLEDLE